MSYARRISFIAGLLVASSSSYSLDASLNVSLGLEHTDNGNKSELDEISDTQRRLGAEFSLSHEGQKLRTELGYRVDKNQYQNDTQDSNTEVSGELSIVYEPIASALFFRLDSSTRNVVNDKAALDIADNRQNRTITTLAPEWIMRIGAADQVNLSVNYTDIRYEDDGQDSDRSGASVKWLHQRSKVDSLSFSANYSDIGMDEERFDYEYYQAFFSYTAQLSKLQYSISIGYNETKSGVNESVRGGFVNAEFNYSSGPSEWAIELGRELTDTSQGGANRGFDQFSSFQNTDSGFDVYETTTVRGSWSNSGICSACTFSAFLSYEDDHYEILLNDSEEVSVNFGFGYAWSRSTQFSLSATYSDFKFTNDGSFRPNYNSSLARVGVSHSITKDFSFLIFVRAEERDSDQMNRDYEELVGGFALKYTIY